MNIAGLAEHAYASLQWLGHVVYTANMVAMQGQA